MKKNTEKKKSLHQKYGVVQMVAGVLSLFLGFVFLLSFSSYLFNWEKDQSQLGAWDDPNIEVQNIFGKLGAWLGETFIHQSLGITAVFWAFWLLFLGAIFIFNLKKVKFLKITLNFLFFSIWVPVFLSFILPDSPIWGGRMGFEIKSYLMNLIDLLGIVLVLLFTLVLFIVFEWKITPETLKKVKKPIFENEIEGNNHEKISEGLENNSNQEFSQGLENLEENSDAAKESSVQKILSLNKRKNINTEEEDDDASISPYLKENEEDNNDLKLKMSTAHPVEPDASANLDELGVGTPQINEIIIEPDDEDDVAMTVETIEEDEVEIENLSQKLVQQFGEFDPRLELSKYQFPKIDLLYDYNKGKNLNIDQSELEVNKNKIVETLKNYKINIDSIKATVGPTVTLYEIVPEAGVRISKIKNLEDDIALSLSALGIRIIAPIPGRGTIGIEVPNNNPTMVSMRSVIASKKFQNSEMELPIAFGKNISNETFVADLAKMPHLLMAGATGQGKSVGINAIITSLLYKKHPAELKFVMVDPKKVELALYNKIERHFLAKLPGVEDAIITDNQKVISTLNSLCIEMDDRYDLLKDACVRNIKEYNEKFKARKLNPENGHRFMPYIVLVVDEFADLIMTAGKEVEGPIARLAQLARAVGIHLIIATQRPSVNVITGIIKANFPARVAYRVTSKVDSRTILDSGGADQLIGKGDMLYTKGNDLIRLQCAFVDTPEVESLADYIGSQKGYPDAFLLPEYEGEEGGSILDIDPNERDSLFDDAARIVVATQQGSASMLQRKLKIGYNRAGRIIDQLEANNIVGPFEGSKAREVLITDENTLEQLLKNQ